MGSVMERKGQRRPPSLAIIAAVLSSQQLRNTGGNCRASIAVGFRRAAQDDDFGDFDVRHAITQHIGTAKRLKHSQRTAGSVVDELPIAPYVFPQPHWRVDEAVAKPTRFALL